MRRDASPLEAGDQGAAEALRAEFLKMRHALRRANTKVLGDE
jgi:hypothetical protein